MLRKIYQDVTANIPEEYKYTVLFALEKITKVVEYKDVIARINNTEFVYTEKPYYYFREQKCYFPSKESSLVTKIKGEEKYLFVVRGREKNLDVLVISTLLHLLSRKSISGAELDGFSIETEESCENEGITNVFCEYLSYNIARKDIGKESIYYLPCLFVKVLENMHLPQDNLLNYYITSNVKGFRQMLFAVYKDVWKTVNYMLLEINQCYDSEHLNSKDKYYYDRCFFDETYIVLLHFLDILDKAGSKEEFAGVLDTVVTITKYMGNVLFGDKLEEYLKKR